MMELIKITETKGVSVVNARDLHFMLGIKSNFRDWIRNHIRDFNFTENQDFIIGAKNLASGQTSKEYAITLGMAKELSMLARNEQGKIARQYFIDRDLELTALKEAERQRLYQRDLARMGCPKMTNALQVQRLEEGKSTKPHHFSNEHNMVYRIVLGATAKKFKEAQDIEGNLRDALTPLQIEAVTKIQDMNTTLIDLGISYKDRKGTLDAFYEKRYSDLMLKEFILLNA